MALEARNRKTGAIVRVGDKVVNFRGETHTLAKIDRANMPDRDGKVTVEGSPISYYARVFDLEVVDTTEVLHEALAEISGRFPILPETLANALDEFGSGQLAWAWIDGGRLLRLELDAPAAEDVA